MEKTIVVLVERVKKDLKYGKRYTLSDRYKVHDEKKHLKRAIKFLLWNAARFSEIKDGECCINNSNF
jgi:hypothetical protein